MSNPYYTPSGSPANNSSGSSSVVRSEFALIEDAFDLMPTLSGNGGKLVAVNSGATGLEAVTSFNLSDGVITRPVIKDFGVTYQNHGNAGATETIDLENGNVHRIVLDQNCTLTFSNPPGTGTYGQFRLIVVQDATGSRTITWPGSVDWSSAAAPTLSTGANDVDVLDFFTVDGGTTWYGSLVMVDAS